MAQIFISHSRHDLPLRQWFDEVFAGALVRAVRFEFEFDAQAKDPIPAIVQLIKQSAALFVLLGPYLLSGTRHTSNWVSAEAGLAKGFGVPIWVFEDILNPIVFPVPFVDHYVRVRRDMREYHALTRYWVNAHQHIEKKGVVLGGWPDPVTPEQNLPCGHAGCQSIFGIHQPIGDIDRCPVCATPQRWVS